MYIYEKVVQSCVLLIEHSTTLFLKKKIKGKCSTSKTLDYLEIVNFQMLKIDLYRTVKDSLKKNFENI